MVVKSAVSFYEIFMSFSFCFASTNVQPDDGNTTLILDILCKIYRGEVWMYNRSPSLYSLLNYHYIGHCSYTNSRTVILDSQESLCIQFWDKESFIDGPIRSLLCNLESEFPFRTVELVRLLSSLSEGTWPAECV